jgi:CheY-like chemotaxis protein
MERNVVMSGTILIVDDDPDIQGMLEAVVNGAGYPVEVASNGEEALAILNRGQPVSLVLLDLMMPVMNGFQFLAEVAKVPAHAAIPVVAVSGAGPSVLASLPASIAILRKPFGVDELLRVIARYKKEPRPSDS